MTRTCKACKANLDRGQFCSDYCYKLYLNEGMAIGLNLDALLTEIARDQD